MRPTIRHNPVEEIYRLKPYVNSECLPILSLEESDGVTKFDIIKKAALFESRLLGGDIFVNYGRFNDLLHVALRTAQ